MGDGFYGQRVLVIDRRNYLEVIDYIELKDILAKIKTGEIMCLLSFEGKYWKACVRGQIYVWQCISEPTKTKPMRRQDR